MVRTVEYESVPHVRHRGGTWRTPGPVGGVKAKEASAVRLHLYKVPESQIHRTGEESDGCQGLGEQERVAFPFSKMKCSCQREEMNAGDGSPTV